MSSHDPGEYAELFAGLGDESRLRIFLALADLAASSGPASFTELREAAGFEDSGHFNYHLQRLTGFLAFEIDDCYYPTLSGWKLATLLSSGRLCENEVGCRRATLGATCRQCGRPLVARFEYEFFVRCPECYDAVFNAPVAPPVAATGDLRTLAHDLDDFDRALTTFLLEQRCFNCGGTTSVSFDDDHHHTDWRPRDVDLEVTVGCSNCWHASQFLTVGQLLLGHPTVREYCDREGVDLHARPQWAYRFTRSDESVVVHSRRPWDVEITAAVDGCRLLVRFADDGSVDSVDHVPVDGRLEN